MTPAVAESPDFFFSGDVLVLTSPCSLLQHPDPHHSPTEQNTPQEAAPPQCFIFTCFAAFLPFLQGAEAQAAPQPEIRCTRPFSLQEHHKQPYKHILSLAAAFYSPVGNCLMLLRHGAPQVAGTSPSPCCCPGPGAGPACPSETKPMGHPPAAHLPVPKGTLARRHIALSLPTSFTLASAAPSVK